MSQPNSFSFLAHMQVGQQLIYWESMVHAKISNGWKLGAIHTRVVASSSEASLPWGRSFAELPPWSMSLWALMKLHENTATYEKLASQKWTTPFDVSSHLVELQTAFNTLLGPS